LMRQSTAGCLVASLDDLVETILQAGAHIAIQFNIVQPQFPVIRELAKLDVSLIEGCLKLAISFKSEIIQFLVRNFAASQDAHQKADDFLEVAFQPTCSSL